MKTIIPIGVISALLLILGCSKNPEEPEKSVPYSLPEQIYTGDLSGEELLFWSLDFRKNVDHIKGVFACDEDGNNVLRLSYTAALFGLSASPSFLADNRVIYIEDNGLGDKIVIIDHGNISYFTPNEIIAGGSEYDFIYIVGMKGVNSDKIAIVTSKHYLYVISLTDRKIKYTYKSTMGLYKPAPLNDGRLAVIANGGDTIKLINSDLSGYTEISVPNTQGGGLIAFDDGKLLYSHSHSDGVVFHISGPGPSEPWQEVTGFPDKYLPGNSLDGTQRVGDAKFAYVVRDDISTAKPSFSVLVASISGANVTDVNAIFTCPIETEKVGSETYLYYLEWYIYE